MGMDARVIDIFCGIGGLSYGFKAEGFDILAGVDLDESCRYAFEENVGAEFFATDVSELSAAKVKSIFGNKRNAHRVLVGCAPCTPFSIYVGRYKRNARNDSRWRLLREFSRIAIAVKPDVISMENVPRLTKHKVFRDFAADLKRVGYSVSYQTIRADQYGVPQRRSRLVLLASLHGPIEMLPPTHLDQLVTVRDAIGDLPRISAGGAARSDRLHVCRGLTDKNLKRIKSTREGGSWKDWSSDLQLDCHKKKSGKTFRSVYGRMRWDAPSPVITTQCLGIGNGRFGHPEQNRAISIREAAILQSFPRRYKLVRPGQPGQGVVLARQIGNAVPVRLSKIIARSIKRHLAGLSYV